MNWFLTTDQLQPPRKFEPFHKMFHVRKFIGDPNRKRNLDLPVPNIGPNHWRLPAQTTFFDAAEEISRYLQKMPPQLKLGSAVLTQFYNNQPLSTGTVA